MRAMAIDGYGQPLHMHDLPVPTPGPGAVRVRVQAAATNPADAKLIAGGFNARILHAKRFPLTLGYDFAGVVDAVGEGADLEVGASVFGFLPYTSANTQGSFAEYLTAPCTELARFDGIAPAVAAASATAASTALQALVDKGGLRDGMRVWINGASGGVGSLAVQIARLLGAEVWGSCSAAKRDYVLRLGAHHVLDYRVTPLPEPGTPFDVILDAAATSSYGRARHLLTPKGVYITTLPDAAYAWGLLLAAFSGRSNRFVVVKSRRADLERLAAWLSAGQLEVPVEATFPLASAVEAMALLGGGSVKGKVAINIG